MSSNKTDVTVVLSALQTMHSKYKFMESSLVEVRKQVKSRHPELLANLEVVRKLISRTVAGGGDGEAFSTYFALADQVHAKAKVTPKGTVCMWLGADVMLEYTYEEAVGMLESHIKAAEVKMREAEEDLDFIRDQVITIEVNMARVFNHDVEVRKAGKLAATVAAK